MRIQHRKQCIGDLRELVVELLVDAPGEERERLDHPLDVRVLAGVALDQQARGDLGIAIGEFLGELAQRGQLLLVVGQDVV